MKEMYKFKTFECRKIEARNLIANPPHSKRGCIAFADSKNVYFYLRCFWLAFDGNSMNVFNNKKQLWKFNFATTEWTKCNLPNQLAFIRGIFFHKNALMILENSYKLHIIRPSSEHEIQMVQTIGNVPKFQLSDHSRVCHDDYLYQVGCNKVGDEVHRLNLRTFLWESLYEREDGFVETAVITQGECKVACDGESIFLLAGYVGGEKINLRDIPVFNLKSRQWTQKSTIGDEKVAYDGYPPLDKGFVSFLTLQLQAGSVIYVTVVTADSENKQKEVSVWKLDVPTLCWKFVHNYSLPFEAIASTFSEDGKHFVVTTSEDHKNNDVFVTSIGACVPKLMDLSWEAVLHYTNGVNNEKLISLGLPMFLNRLE